MDSSTVFGIAATALWQTTSINAFVPPRPVAQKISSWTSRQQQQRHPSHLSVSIGLGPEPEVKNTTERIILGEDGLPLPLITDHEPYRLARLSKSDNAADEWYASLLNNAPPSFLGSISENAHSTITTPVDLVDEPKYEYGHEEWTPYVSRRLPTSPLYPAYGLERFGLPILRKGAEAWRHFDVGGLVEVDYSGFVEGVGE
jgi:hypothetical protein